MKRWLMGMPNDARLLLLFLMSTGALLSMALIANLVMALFDGTRQIDLHQSKIERLLGYEALAPQLENAALEVSGTLRQLAYPGSEDANQSGAKLQQALRGFAEESGLQVVGSQFLVLESEIDAEDDKTVYFDALAVDLSLEGLPIALDAFLLEVQGHTPKLAIASMDIQRKRVSRRDLNEARGDLTVRIRVLALKESP